MSIDANAMNNVDYSAVKLVAPEKPWHAIVEEETANILMAVEGKPQNPAQEETATKSSETKFFSVAEAEGYSVLIDFEKICVWDHDGEVKVGIRLEDPDYMKKRLMEWVHAVAAYVHFLHASADIP